MNTEEPIAETRRPHPHRKLATNTANIGKRSSARQIPGKNSLTSYSNRHLIAIIARSINYLL